MRAVAATKEDKHFRSGLADDERRILSEHLVGVDPAGVRPEHQANRQGGGEGVGGEALEEQLLCVRCNEQVRREGKGRRESGVWLEEGKVLFLSKHPGAPECSVGPLGRWGLGGLKWANC